MRTIRISSFLLAAAFFAACQTTAPETTNNTAAFSFRKKLHLPGNPVAVYDSLTGDVSPWWDHSFSAKPYKLYIEAKAGGGFYELFDSLGNGAKHAEVIYAHRGRMLRLDGPLGLSGNAVQIVSSFRFDSLNADSTLLQFDLAIAGAIDSASAEIVSKVWDHFLFERFKPYLEHRLNNEQHTVN